MAYDKGSTPVIRDAKELCAFTLKKTQNLNNFPNLNYYERKMSQLRGGERNDY